MPLIYKLHSPKHNLTYFGSTELTLKDRHRRHISAFKGWKKNKGAFATSHLVISTNNYKISIMEECNLDNMKEREDYYICHFNCVNHNRPGRTARQYYLDNSMKLKEYQKQYNASNRGYQNERLVCICGTSYTRQNKTNHCKTRHHQEFITEFF